MTKNPQKLKKFFDRPCPGSFVATPDKLASAGFFLCPRDEYLDRCVCFCCGLALVRWDSQDDPWFVTFYLIFHFYLLITL